MALLAGFRMVRAMTCWFLIAMIGPMGCDRPPAPSSSGRAPKLGSPIDSLSAKSSSPRKWKVAKPVPLPQAGESQIIFLPNAVDGSGDLLSASMGEGLGRFIESATRRIDGIGNIGSSLPRTWMEKAKSRGVAVADRLPDELDRGSGWRGLGKSAGELLAFRGMVIDRRLVLLGPISIGEGPRRAMLAIHDPSLAEGLLGLFENEPGVSSGGEDGLTWVIGSARKRKKFVADRIKQPVREMEFDCSGEGYASMLHDARQRGTRLRGTLHASDRDSSQQIDELKSERAVIVSRSSWDCDEHVNCLVMDRKRAVLVLEPGGCSDVWPAGDEKSIGLAVEIQPAAACEGLGRWLDENWDRASMRLVNRLERSYR
jgi:hypothetical protein